MKWQRVLQKGRKHFGKTRNCSLQARSPFLTVFSKDMYVRHIKKQGFVWERVNALSNNNCRFSQNNPFPNKSWLLCVCITRLLKTLWEKEKLLVTSNFSFFPQCFLPVWRTVSHFHQIWNCCLQTLSVWKSLKFVVWKRVKGTSRQWINSLPHNPDF